MDARGIFELLSRHPHFGMLPKEELLWLAERGRYERQEKDTVVNRRGDFLVELYMVLSGRIAIHVWSQTGSRRVREWRSGDLTGKLPYSRMSTTPGDTVIEETMDAIGIHERFFPEMIRECPQITAACVHAMLDRARTFNTAQLQDEKMLSLGRVAAGLAHELNNPASASVRNAQQLLELRETERAARELGALGLGFSQLAAIEQIREVCLEPNAVPSRSPLEQADRVDEIRQWLEDHQATDTYAETLADTPVTLRILDALATSLKEGSPVASAASPEHPSPGPEDSLRAGAGRVLAADARTTGAPEPAGAERDRQVLDATLRWIAGSCSTRALARDIERATSRILQIVSSIKRFTYMDRAQVPEPVEVGQLLHDTATVLGSKARARSISLRVDVEEGLPRVTAYGGELNQVWMNLIDNAIDAAPPGGTVEVSARQEHAFVVVRVVDNGPGIPDEDRLKIFDPFFTTKPPGEGTGLGLDIVHRILRRHGAEINVDSRPGRTEFRVGLPLSPPATPGRAALGPSADGV